MRQVCDELLLVHAGTLSRFAGDLDDYPAWLAARQPGSPERATDAAPTAPKPGNRKRLRQQEAQRRLALQPLANRVREVEEGLARARERLAGLEERLADGGLYADPARRDEMGELLREQGTLRARVESLEQQWLDASEALETAVGSDDAMDGPA